MFKKREKEIKKHHELYWFTLPQGLRLVLCQQAKSFTKKITRLVKYNTNTLAPRKSTLHPTTHKTLAPSKTKLQSATHNLLHPIIVMNTMQKPTSQI